jgi:hypothetical protein
MLASEPKERLNRLNRELGPYDDASSFSFVAIIKLVTYLKDCDFV